MGGLRMKSDPVWEEESAHPANMDSAHNYSNYQKYSQQMEKSSAEIFEQLVGNLSTVIVLRGFENKHKLKVLFEGKHKLTFLRSQQLEMSLCILKRFLHSILSFNGSNY